MTAPFRNGNLKKAFKRIVCVEQHLAAFGIVIETVGQDLGMAGGGKDGGTEKDKEEEFLCP